MKAVTSDEWSVASQFRIARSKSFDSARDGKERRKRAFSVPIRNCHVMCFLQVSILLLVFSVRLEFFRSKIELYGFGLCSLRGVCAMQSAFRGEDKLTAETEGFAGLIARIVVEREHICLV